MSYIGKTPTAAPLTSGDIADGIISTAKIANDAVTAIKADFDPGKILQVLQTVKTDSFSTTSTSFTDITGMSQAITPTASNSKIMIFINLTASATGATNIATRFLLLRGSTAIALPSATGSQYGSFVDQRYSGNDSRNMSFHFLDSPSTTNAVTYKLQMTRANSGSGTVQIGNRLADGQQETPSIFTVMEVGA